MSFVLHIYGGHNISDSINHHQQIVLNSSSFKDQLPLIYKYSSKQSAVIFMQHLASLSATNQSLVTFSSPEQVSSKYQINLVSIICLLFNLLIILNFYLLILIRWLLLI